MGLWRAPGGTLEGPQQYHTEGLWHHTVGVGLDGPPRAAKGASGAAAGAAGAAVGGSGTAARASGRPLRHPGILGGGPVFVPPLGWGARERRFPKLHLGVGAWCPFRARSLQHPANAARGASCARARVRLIVLLRSPSARAFAQPFAARARVLGASGRRPGRPSCTLLSSAYAIRPPQPIELHRVPLAWPTRRGALNSDCNVGRSARQCCCRAQWLRHRAVARARLGSCGRRGARQCPSRL